MIDVRLTPEQRARKKEMRAAFRYTLRRLKEYMELLNKKLKIVKLSIKVVADKPTTITSSFILVVSCKEGGRSDPEEIATLSFDFMSDTEEPVTLRLEEGPEPFAFTPSKVRFLSEQIELVMFCFTLLAVHTAASVLFCEDED